ncbi:MAG: hypothetical protein ACRD1Z_05065 [Vicinamibacteria bacterium]
MKAEYDAWIKANVEGDGFGLCKGYARRMAQAFPELRLVRGYYHDALWGRRGHWWLALPDGSIVDPTAAQFPTRGNGEYEEFTGDESELPTGKCPNCGEFCYDGRSFCSEECGRSFAAYLNEERRRW